MACEPYAIAATHEDCSLPRSGVRGDRPAPALPETTRVDGVKGRGDRTVDLQLVVLDHAVGITFLHLYERVLDALHVVDR